MEKSERTEKMKDMRSLHLRIPEKMAAVLEKESRITGFPMTTVIRRVLTDTFREELEVLDSMEESRDEN